MSTLLSDLESSPPSQRDGDLVDQILNEMNSGGGGGNTIPPPTPSGFPGNPGVISSPTQNTIVNSHVMDTAPARSHMIGNSQPTPADFAAAMHGGGNGSSYASANDPLPPPPTMPYKMRKSLMQRFMDEMKVPLIVAILVFVFSLPVVNFLFLHYLPSMALPTGQLTLIGTVIKSIIAGISFWIIHRVIVPLFSI